MAASSAQARAETAGHGQDGDNAKKIIEPHVQYVTQAGLTVPIDKAWLVDEADVYDDLAALKAVMMKVINEGKRVQI